MANINLGDIAVVKQKLHHARQRHLRPDQGPVAAPAGSPQPTIPQSKMLQPKVVGSVLLGKDRILKVVSLRLIAGRCLDSIETISTQDYKYGEVLGSGAFGVVRVAWGRNKKT
jgi:hypothetical protein